ncbi:MAG TPA: SdrD B-like domain-containing protein [Bacteroidia bacterium]|nr:SdrD B-like domain-containing protein [Bacteroidia bacterium]
MKKILLLITGIFICFTANAQLTGMNPASAGPGQTLQTTVTGPGLFLQGSSPSGNLFSVYLTNGSTSIAIFDYGNMIFNNITVNSTDDFTTDFFNIPITATPGSYLLTVVTGDMFNPWWNQQTYTLPNAFTVLPPDGYINGNIYSDTNQNGIKDAGEPGIQNETVTILPGYYQVLTNASGDYSAPAMNGVHTVQWSPSYYRNYQLSSDSVSFSVSVNGNTQGGFDFGLKPALLSMSVNYSQIGGTVFTTITSDGAFTTTPYVYIRKGSYNIYAGNETFVNSNTATCNFVIPFNTIYIGTYDLYVYWSGIYYMLPAAFTVTPFNAGITGKVYFDTNGNGVYDAGEAPLANSKVELTPGNILAFTDNSGDYGFGTANGTYTVTYLPRNYETVTSAPSYSVVVNNNVAANKDFGVQISPTFDSLSLYIEHYLVRCNVPFSIYGYVTNHGADPANGRLVMVQDPAMGTIVTAPPPDYYSNDTLYWNFSNLAVGQTFTRLPTFTAPSAGTFLNFKFIAQQLDAGNNVIFSSELSFSNTVSCSFDPNDKHVQPPGVQAPHYTLFGEDLYYTIRFQNTGNDTAFRVIIYDTLDTDLDFNTFEFISSSHGVKTELNPSNGALKFTFNNILLPDSNINEPMSHGEVTYRIQTKQGLPSNTVINNTAYIVFDLNTPVITNTSLNTMIYETPLPIELLYFNAESDHSGSVLLTWATATEINNDYFTVERSGDRINFTTIETLKGAGNSTFTKKYSCTDEIPLPGLNYYRLKQTDYNGKFEYSGILAIDIRKPGLTVTELYPNPVSTSLNCAFYVPSETKICIEITDVYGRSVLRLSQDVVTGNNTVTVDLTDEKQGVYNLKITDTKTMKVIVKPFVTVTHRN